MEELQQQIVDLETQVRLLSLQFNKNQFSNNAITTKDMVMQNGSYGSFNFVTGVSGWQFDAEGNLEANNGTFRGTITATTGTIGGFTIGTDYIRDVANTFGLASTVTGGDDVRFWAGASFANRATAPARITEAGAAFFSNVYIGGANIQYIATDQGIFSFGDGSDGAGVADGVTALAGASLAGSTYTLTRDVSYTNLTVSTGITIKPAGYRIFGTGVLTLNGTANIERNGNAGSAPSPLNTGTSGAGGAALADGYLKGSVAGGQGGNGYGTLGVGNPANGDAVTNGTATSNSLGSNGANGGAGNNGGGGAGGAGAGGTGGTATAANVRLKANWQLQPLLDISASGATVKYDNSAGAAGGGGGGSNTGGASNGGSGGGGGSAGGIIAIYFRSIIIGASASITANGGAGGAGGTGSGGTVGGGGGGGGGNGGQIILVYNLLANSGSITVTAGAGGAGGVGSGGTGTAGTAGTVGTIYQFLLSQ